MAVYSLPVFDITYITTSNPSGFNDNGGYQFNLGVDTVTIQPGAVSNDISVTDFNDEFFDDDGGTRQVLNGAQVINGTNYADGTVIEAEYILEVQDSSGTSYGLQFVSLNSDAVTIHGFVVQGTMPPWNTPLTVVQNYDNVQGYLRYDTATPACFGPRVRIATASGAVEAARLRPGEQVRLADGGTARLRLKFESRVVDAGRGPGASIRLRKDSLGPGLPARDMILSSQHRVRPPGWDQLVPAKALTALPRIGRARVAGPARFVHLVLDRHALLLAEGLSCESFWPGTYAMRMLPSGLARRIRSVMGPRPQPAAPFLSVTEARARLRAGRLTDPEDDV